VGICVHIESGADRNDGDRDGNGNGNGNGNGHGNGDGDGVRMVIIYQKYLGK